MSNHHAAQQLPGHDTLKNEALNALEGNWGLAIGVYAVFIIINLLVGAVPVLGSIAGLIIAGPLTFGWYQFSLTLSRKEPVRFEMLFAGFNDFGRAFVAYLLMALFILLWMLLLIIPGIIAAIAYSQTFFIMAEDKNISAAAAIEKSQAMMRGHKWEYFFVGLSFIGWLLLCILTIGIGLIILGPYISTTFARFYEAVKKDYLIRMSGEDADNADRSSDSPTWTSDSSENSPA